MKRTLALLAASAVLFTACSDDDDPITPTTESANYLPMTSGSYWIYDGVETDSSNAEVDGTQKVDSVVVGASFTNGDMSGNYLVTYNDDTEVSADPYATDEENGILYTYIDLFPLEGLIDTNEFKLDSRWVKVADANADSWTVLDTNVADIAFTIEDVPDIGTVNVVVEGNLLAQGEKTGTQEIEIEGETVVGEVYTLTQSLDLTLNATIPGLGTIPVPMADSFSFEVVVVDEVGVFSTYRAPINLALNLGEAFGSFELLQLNGYKQTLTRFALAVE